MQEENTKIVIYQKENGDTGIDVRFENESVWLSQAQVASIFDVTTQNIVLHLKNIYSEGELEEDSTCKEFLQVQKERSRK